MSEEHSSLPKFSVTFKRVIQVFPFETVTVGLTREFFVGKDDFDEAFEWVHTKVEEWISSFCERPEIKLQQARKWRKRD